MYKNSIAKNHLSEAAKEGRYGDNILVHMSKDEADVLAKSAGLEKLPTNPKTGFPEAWIFTALSVGLGAYNAWKGGKEQASQAGTQSKLMSQQQGEIEQALGSLDNLKSSKETVAMAEYDQAIGNLSSRTGQSKEDLQKQYESMVNKTGMATSGSAQTNRAQTYRRIQNQFSQGSTDLLGKLGQSMAGVEEWYEGEKSRLESEQKRIGLQKQLSDKQSSSWYLGKNIFG